eukprot:sb/3470601/
MNRDRGEPLENLMMEMMKTNPADRPPLDIVSQACGMILEQYHQVTSTEILDGLYNYVSKNNDAAEVISKRTGRNLKSGMNIKPRTKSPYQLVSIQDNEGELRDGSLIEDTQEPPEPQTGTEPEAEQIDPDDTASSTQDILDVSKYRAKNARPKRKKIQRKLKILAYATGPRCGVARRRKRGNCSAFQLKIQSPRIFRKKSP